MRRPTLRDVADAAGVSTQTVSRVVNDHPRVAPSTRNDVQDWIQRLGYRPSVVARGLQANRSFSIGVVLFGMHYFGPAQTLTGIVKACSDRGLATLLPELPVDDDFDVDRSLGSLVERHVDGILLSVTNAESTVEQLGSQLKNIRVPIVFVRCVGPAGYSSVSTDNEAAMMQVVDHLAQTGRTRIAHIAGVAEWDESEGRRRGWHRGLQSAGLDADPSLVASGDWTPQSGFDAMATLLDRDPSIDAVAVANDQMALGAIAYLRQRGLRVPDDIAITGFDDLAEVAWTTPPLTSVHQPLAELGARAVDTLLAEVDATAESPSLIKIPASLVTRTSSAPRGQAEPDAATRSA